MGTFTKNITPKISAAVSYNVVTDVTASGVVFTTASDEYAIIQMNYKKDLGATQNFFLNSNSVNLFNKDILLNADTYGLPGVIFYIGPGQSVSTNYVFSPGVLRMFITITGVVFKNS